MPLLFVLRRFGYSAIECPPWTPYDRGRTHCHGRFGIPCHDGSFQSKRWRSRKTGLSRICSSVRVALYTTLVLTFLGAFSFCGANGIALQGKEAFAKVQHALSGMTRTAGFNTSTSVLWACRP